jgi:hypothetical protein
VKQIEEIVEKLKVRKKYFLTVKLSKCHLPSACSLSMVIFSFELLYSLLFRKRKGTEKM